MRCDILDDAIGNPERKDAKREAASREPDGPRSLRRLPRTCGQPTGSAEAFKKKSSSSVVTGNDASLPGADNKKEKNNTYMY